MSLESTYPFTATQKSFYTLSTGARWKFLISEQHPWKTHSVLCKLYSSSSVPYLSYGVKTSLLHLQSFVILSFAGWHSESCCARNTNNCSFQITHIARALPEEHTKIKSTRKFDFWETRAKCCPRQGKAGQSFICGLSNNTEHS